MDKKRRVQALTCGVFLGTAVVLLQPCRARADLHFKEPVADAGEVRTGPFLKHRFAFVNQGPDPVEITEVRTTCGCLQPRLTQRSFQPGEEGELAVEVNTLSQPAGLQTWHVLVNYRSGQSMQEMSLQLRAHLIREITVQPAAMTLYVDNAVQHEIILTDLRERPLSITRVGGSSPHLTGSVVDETQDCQGHWVCKMRVRVAEDFPEGRHEEIIGIHTTDEIYRELKVPVTLIKRSPTVVSATPNQVVLKAASGQLVSAQIVRIRNPRGEPVVVDKVQSGDPALVCHCAAGPGAMATLKISADRRRMQGQTLQTTVQVHVSKPAPQILTIPVTCTVQ